MELYESNISRIEDALERCEWHTIRRNKEMIEEKFNNYKLRMLLLGYRPRTNNKDNVWIDYNDYNKKELID